MPAAPIQPLPFAQSRWLLWGAVGGALVILGLSIVAGSWHLRAQTRAQIARRDAEVLHAIAAHQLSESGEDELTAVLQSSTQKGVLAMRVFTPNGAFDYGLPAHVTEARLDSIDTQQLRTFQPIGRLHENFALGELLLPLPGEPAPPSSSVRSPVLEVLIPIHHEGEKKLLGIAQFLIDGTAIVGEYRALDANLARQVILAFVAGGGVLLLSLGWSLRRLQQSNRLLFDRTANLLRANQELALAAKSSAVGAITSHLIHGLKNPLAGLHQFVAQRARDNPEEADTDWLDALATSKRMQSLIADVVRVLHEADGTARYELTLPELGELIEARVQPIARNASVRFEWECQTAGALNNRDANLITLILENLIHNALQASPRNVAVRLLMRDSARGVVFEVRDEGPGLPVAVKKALFSPCQSTKIGGSGIGLAISKQLGNHLNAELRLKSDSPAGCVFELDLPGARVDGKWLIAGLGSGA